MDINKLAKQVKKEIKASPVRAGVLAIVIVVAIYFWAPLLMKWTGVGKKALPVATPAVPTDSTTGPMVAAAGKPSIVDYFRWQSFLDSVRNDATMTTKMPELNRNPFRSLDGETEEAPEIVEEDLDTPKDDAIPFEELGIQLESTLVGRRGGTAMIDGKVVTLMKSDPSKPFTIKRGEKEIELLLTQIRNKAVEVKYEGETFVLAIEEDSAETTGSVIRN